MTNLKGYGERQSKYLDKFYESEVATFETSAELPSTQQAFHQQSIGQQTYHKRWMDEMPVHTGKEGTFDRHGITYRYDEEGIYIGNYKMPVQPIIVEKEIVKEVFVTKVSPLGAAMRILSTTIKESRQGNEIYLQDEKQVITRKKGGVQ